MKAGTHGVVSAQTYVPVPLQKAVDSHHSTRIPGYQSPAETRAHADTNTEMFQHMHACSPPATSYALHPGKFTHCRVLAWLPTPHAATTRQ